MEKRKKLNIDEQILRLKGLKIRFENLSDEDARRFLMQDNYLFKIQSFAENYKKHRNFDGYVNLDFSYLQKFSELDEAFRMLVLELALACEHMIKTRLCALMSENPLDDGYFVVRKFCEFIRQKGADELEKTGIYISQMVEKYGDDMPVWVFLETISLGKIIWFYEFYMSFFFKFKCFKNFYKQKNNIFVDCKFKRQKIAYFYKIYKNMSNINLSLFRFVKRVRNAAAHNNCILHTFTTPDSSISNGKSDLKNALQKHKIFVSKQEEARERKMLFCKFLSFMIFCV